MASAEALFLFVIVIVFSQLSLSFEKQFFDHPTPLKIGGDLKHCPVVLHVLLYDKTLQKSPPKVAADLSLMLALDENPFAYFV
jgi:hypothetical protein